MQVLLSFVPSEIQETEEHIEFTARILSADTEIQTPTGTLTFSPGALFKAQEQLVGLPVLLDHEWKVDKIVGVVVHGWYDDSEKALFARIRITKEGNEKLVSLLKMQPSPIKSVSIGGHVVRHGDKVIELTLKEVSLVLYGADPNAKILSATNLSEKEWWEDPELRERAPRDYFLEPNTRRYPYKTWDGQISCERLKAAMSLSAMHGHTHIYERARKLYERHCKEK